MATVYLARDVKHDRHVALKVLHAELSGTIGPDRFRREIAVAARLQHPNILTVFDSGETAGYLWFTMPYVEGETLRDRLLRDRQLSLDDTLAIAAAVAHALDFAHRHGVLHRDIKPENILLTSDEGTLVGDFGVARALAASDQQPQQPVTTAGIALGTPAYMSPEQSSADRSIDARSDVYSLGCVVYEMLAGEPPFTGATPQAIIAKRFASAAPSIRVTRTTIPPKADDAIQRALASVPADRYASAGDFVRALREASQAPSPHDATTALTGAARPSRWPLPISFTVLALGFVLGVGVLFAWRRPTASPPAGDDRTVIAVLPFENLGALSDEYFTDGMTDEVRGRLASLPGLRVIASQSASQYKHSNKTLSEIAKELGASFLLTGKVRWDKSGGKNRVLVSPELVSVSPGTAPTTRWQAPFDAELTDVFTVQADISARVAEQLGLALGGNGQAALAARPTANLDAYDVYLRAEEVVRSGDINAYRAAIGEYRRAVQLDSSFGLAWAQLARAAAFIYVNGTPTAELKRETLGAATRALSLSPNAPQSYIAMGDYQRGVLADPRAASATYERGLRIGPNDADLLAAIGFCDVALGRWEEALARLTLAAALDPRSGTIGRRIGNVLLWLHRSSEAAAQFDRTQVLAPTNMVVVGGSAMARLQQGDLAGAQRVIRAGTERLNADVMLASAGTYWDLVWVPDAELQKRVPTLSLSAFAGDTLARTIVLTEFHALHGDSALMRVYADTSAQLIRRQLRNQDDTQRHALLGLMSAYLGQKAAAIAEGEAAVARVSIAQDPYRGSYYAHLLARTYVLVGEKDKALSILETLVHGRYFLTPAWLRIDPYFGALRSEARFQKLASGG